MEETLLVATALLILIIFGYGLTFVAVVMLEQLRRELEDE